MSKHISKKHFERTLNNKKKETASKQTFSKTLRETIPKNIRNIKNVTISVRSRVMSGAKSERKIVENLHKLCKNGTEMKLYYG